KPLLAGLMMGCMVYKPHLTPILGVALLAGRRWTALSGFALGGLGLCGLSLLALGRAPWEAFVANVPFAQAVLYEGGVAWEKMPTTSAALLLLGAPAAAAKVGQLIVSAGVALAVGALWWWEARAELRLAATSLGVLLATPFAFEYDLVILALPLAWLGVLGQETGWRHGEVAVLALAWVLPILAPGFAGLTSVQLGPLVMGGLLGLLWRRSLA
ncbi:MAG: DUF2029 domain-containing protein, partial [Alphaproteobacteria bacterium]|nr:DUF2029 domain-containing protein [Alphaproteobacteria bacterium]